MNKGKPSGFKAETKKDVGAKSTVHERAGQAGTKSEPIQRRRRKETEPVHAGGQGGPDQNAGGPEHFGGDPHEDRNP
jgi:hypothetical protein